MIPSAPSAGPGDGSRVIFGAAGLASMRQERADGCGTCCWPTASTTWTRRPTTATSELRLSPWMAQAPPPLLPRHQDGRTHRRPGPGPAGPSLERLQVDRVDLIQLHNLVEPGSGRWLTGRPVPSGRWPGPGRGPGAVHRRDRARHPHRRHAPARSLERFPFDSVLLPYSFVSLRDPAYQVDVEALLALCAEQGVAVQTIKGAARAAGPTTTRAGASAGTSRSPTAALDRAVRWVLAHDQVFLNSTNDLRLLPGAVLTEAAGAGAGPPTDDEMAADAARLDVAPLFDGELERI